jgi:omega-amidase
MWNCPYSNNSFPIYAEDIDAGFEASPSSAMLSEVACQKKVTIVGGSIPERSNGHLYNTCCVFDKDGHLKAKHRKVCASCQEFFKIKISHSSATRKGLLILLFI